MQQDSIACACGCGESLIPFDHWGRPRRFISGHNRRGARVIDRKYRPLEERFWERVDKSGQCWLWMGSKNALGYGGVRVNKRLLRAHRLAYEIANGPIPDGLFVLHQCDTPACVRPDHLRVGTQSDNVIECVERGRHRGGAPVGRASRAQKLRDEDVLEIRRSYAKGIGTDTLALKYAVSRGHIRAIIFGRSRRDVG